jgi:hypothetical protein
LHHLGERRPIRLHHRQPGRLSIFTRAGGLAARRNTERHAVANLNVVSA